ncbi:MAG TPA: TadE/TadG family type IV pilus assembly protein [Capillimicrobium sp.]|nr:TadE/TadG family type IV pilus assembly protein [Capillimicrobium sp.]
MPGGVRSRAGERGQATVELVGLLPVLVAVALGAAQLLAAGVARELADHAAEAGAVALLQGGDAAEAARAAVPGWARGELRVEVADRAVTVEVDPPIALPRLAGELVGRATAHAGGGGS